MLKNFDKITSSGGCAATIKSNFHTHNYLCGHAGGTVSDFCKVAVEHGLKALGISDHCAPPIGWVHNPTFSVDRFFAKYLPQFDEAEKLYGDKIKILKGVEIEYFDGYDDYYRKLLGSLDYLVLGQHDYMNGDVRKSVYADGTDESDAIAYCDNVKRGLRSGYFALLAHPDIIFYNGISITDKIATAFDDVVKTAVKLDIPLELNANGIRSHAFRYPTDLLIELCKKHNAKVVVSADSHSPNEMCDEPMYRLCAYARTTGLNVVDNIRKY